MRISQPSSNTFVKINPCLSMKDKKVQDIALYLIKEVGIYLTFGCISAYFAATPLIALGLVTFGLFCAALGIVYDDIDKDLQNTLTKVQSRHPQDKKKNQHDRKSKKGL